MSDYPPPPPPQGGYGAPPPPLAAPRPAELVDRFLARLVDGVILGVAYGIVIGIVTGIFVTGYRSGAEVFFYYLLVSVLSTALYLGYYAYLESSRGQTVGKMVIKLKVVGPDGVSNPTLEQALRRNIWMAAGLLSIVPFVGVFLGGAASLAAVVFIAIGINNDTAKRQGWHDQLAGGTQVLKVG